jgi:hypothetical protein
VRATASLIPSSIAQPHIALHLISAIAHDAYVVCFVDPERDPVW